MKFWFVVRTYYRTGHLYAWVFFYQFNWGTVMSSDGETVKVIVRCRPMNTREKDLKCTTVVAMEGKRGQCSIRNPDDKKAPPKMFTFDGAYFVDSTTENIYNEIAYPLVEVKEGHLCLSSIINEVSIRFNNSCLHCLLSSTIEYTCYHIQGYFHLSFFLPNFSCQGIIILFWIFPKTIIYLLADILINKRVFHFIYMYSPTFNSPTDERSEVGKNEMGTKFSSIQW